MVYARYQSHIAIEQRSRHGREIVGADTSVAVRDRQHIMAHACHHVHQVADLKVASLMPLIDDDIDRQRREFSYELLNYRERRVSRIAHAKHNLKLRVILQAK